MESPTGGRAATTPRWRSRGNRHGSAKGRPYFSFDGNRPATREEWAALRSKFQCPHGVTNVWERPPLNGKERIRIGGKNGKAVHLNQKPLDLTAMIIEASSDKGDVMWEPFGGLFTACVAARRLKRRAYGCEIDSTYFQYGIGRLKEEVRQGVLLK